MTTIQDIRKQKDNDIPTFYTIERNPGDPIQKSHMFSAPKTFPTNLTFSRFLVHPKHAGSPTHQKNAGIFPEFLSIFRRFPRPTGPLEEPRMPAVFWRLSGGCETPGAWSPMISGCCWAFGIQEITLNNIWVIPKKRTTPKWMVYLKENPINPWMIWGKTHYFRKHPYIYLYIFIFIFIYIYIWSNYSDLKTTDFPQMVV